MGEYYVPPLFPPIQYNSHYNHTPLFLQVFITIEYGNVRDTASLCELQRKPSCISKCGSKFNRTTITDVIFIKNAIETCFCEGCNMSVYQTLCQQHCRRQRYFKKVNQIYFRIFGENFCPPPVIQFRGGGVKILKQKKIP